MDDKYEVERVVCHSCAARDRKRDLLAEAAGDGGLKPFGEYLIVHPE